MDFQVDFMKLCCRSNITDPIEKTDNHVQKASLGNMTERVFNNLQRCQRRWYNHSTCREDVERV